MANFRDGQEVESGTIRRDPARVRGRRDDSRAGKEARGASADGAPGDCQRDPARTQETRTATAQIGTVAGGHRWHPGGRSAGAAETETHGASHLDATAGGVSGTSD